MAHAGKRRRGRGSVLRAHARLVQNRPAHGILVPRAKRSRGWGRRGRSRGAGQAVLVSHCRAGLRSCVRDLAPGDVGGHRSSPVCDFDDGRRVADGTAHPRHAARRRVGVAVLRPRPGDVGFARRVSAAFVSRVRRFHLRLSAQPNRSPTVRACVRSGRLLP